VSAFGLLPFALVMLQLRVFYAMKDARTPTIIQLLLVATKIPLLLICPLVLPPDQVVLGLAAANATSFLVGAVVGQAWIRRRLGHLGSKAVLVTVAKTAAAGAAGALAGLGVLRGLHAAIGSGLAPVPMAWLVLITGGTLGLVVTVIGMRVVRLSEVAPLFARLSALLSARRAA
jgi:putative peptidoglycan lipid II flippase